MGKATVLWLLVAAVVLWGLTLAVLLPDWGGQRRLRRDVEARNSAYEAAHPGAFRNAAVPSDLAAADSNTVACLPVAGVVDEAACAAALDQIRPKPVMP